MSRDQAVEKGRERGTCGEAGKIWCVCDSVQGDVESYHPSYAWAMEWIGRRADARPGRVQARVREVEAGFSGQAYRVVTTAWDRYRAVLQVAAESQELASRECLVRRAALDTGRARRVAKREMQRLKVGGTPKKRPPVHELDVPELVAISADDFRSGPILARASALKAAADENRRYLAQGAHWDGHWCLVLELGDFLPGMQMVSEFAGELGVESYTACRPVRLVHPTPAELAQFVHG